MSEFWATGRYGSIFLLPGLMFRNPMPGALAFVPLLLGWGSDQSGIAFAAAEIQRGFLALPAVYHDAGQRAGGGCVCAADC